MVESCRDEAKWKEEVKVAIQEDGKREEPVKRGPVKVPPVREAKVRRGL